MKQILQLTILLISIVTSAQNKVLFEYDNAGNQIKRSLCINCPTTSGKNTNETPKEIADLKEADFIKSFPEDIISYYPNPVKEQLYLKWELINDDKVAEIQLYSLSGQLLKSFNKLETTNNQIITFQEFPQGIYTLLLFYSSGDQKSIKIIKQ